METVGWLIDKLTVNELKIYHAQEKLQAEKDEASINDLNHRLEVLASQRAGLMDELKELIADMKSGKKQIKVFRQMKMYNKSKYIK